MLSKRLAIVELAMPRSTSSLHLAFPSLPCPGCDFFSVECEYIGNVKYAEEYSAAIDLSKIFG
jgi:hypothetical protein